MSCASFYAHFPTILPNIFGNFGHTLEFKSSYVGLDKDGGDGIEEVKVTESKIWLEQLVSKRFLAFESQEFPVWHSKLKVQTHIHFV